VCRTRGLFHFVFCPSFFRDGSGWLRRQCAGISGRVLSIGSGTDEDGEGRRYRDYFPKASSYTTSEVTADFACDLTLDVRSMPEIADETYDCVYCSGVLEHVDGYRGAFGEITRILKRGGTLLLGLPFRQPIRLPPSTSGVLPNTGSGTCSRVRTMSTK
jgi:SAM-dependent methyltransferase